MSQTHLDGFIISWYLLFYGKYHELTNASLASFNLVCLSIVVTFILKYSVKSKKVLTSKEVALINKNRKYGNWTPDYDFKTPIPPPYPNWDVKNTKPLPYRAFKHKYNINMGIRSMDWKDWIELDNEWPFFHEEKLKRVKERGTELYRTDSTAKNAAYELLEELWNYLPHRYPGLFKQTTKGLDCVVTGESYAFREGFRTDEDPMFIAAQLVQDDLAIMIEGDNGEYFLKAGAIILAGFWRLRDKFNMPLKEIHTSGDVPKFKEKLQSGMEKFFIRQSVDSPVVRNNYFIQTDDNLGWSVSIGDEKNERVGWYTAEPAEGVENLYFRSERQTLRRLPRTGAIVFTIRTYFLPIIKLANEPHVPRRLFNGINSWEPSVREYKGLSKFENVLLPYLEEVAERQESEGYTVDKEDSQYPF